MLQTLALSREHFADSPDLLASLDDIAQIAFISQEFQRLEKAFYHHDYDARDLWSGASCELQDLGEAASALLGISLAIDTGENKAAAHRAFRQKCREFLETLRSYTGQLEMVEQDVYAGTGGAGNAMQSLSWRIALLMRSWKET